MCIRELYAADVRYVDAAIGRIVDTLEELGIYDETLIVLTSDHGEEFWEHDSFEHGHSLYDEVLRVPLIMTGPGITEEGEIKAPVSIESIFATILGACGIGFDRESVSSTSLTAKAAEGSDRERAETIAAGGVLYYESRQAIVSEKYKYIRSTITGKEELYDLLTDPGERVSIEHSSPLLLQEARGFLEAHLARADSLRERLGLAVAEECELDRTTVERLRALGYTR